MEKQEEYVLRTVEERGVRFIRLWFSDVLGFLKSFAITPAEATIVVTGSVYLVGRLRDRWHPTEEVILQRTSWPESS